MSDPIQVKVDTTQAERDLQQLKQHVTMTEVSIMKSTKKVYQSFVLLADVFGYAVPMWFNLLASAAIMAGETFAALAAAETMSGWLAVKSIVTFGIATAMFYRGMILQTQASEAEQKLNSLLQFSNIWMTV